MPSNEYFIQPGTINTLNIIKRIALILSALAVCELALFASAAEMHVAVTGNDSNPGTAGKPLRTIQAAAQKAQPGDTITVHAGTYRETVIPAASGQPDKPIIILTAVVTAVLAIAPSVCGAETQGATSARQLNRPCSGALTPWSSDRSLHSRTT